MNLKPFRLLCSKIAHELENIDSAAIAAAGYYFFDGKWTSLDGKNAVDKELSILLDGLKKNSIDYFRPRAKTKTYIYIKPHDAIIEIDFNVVIKTARQQAVKNSIDRLCIESANEYGASHDKHTGLRNRSAFDQLLIEEIASARAVVDIGVVADAASITDQQVYLLSLDIDHFKSVNDRFGHGYGDVVLAAFAWRLEDMANKITQEQPGKIALDVFRLGGEEFQVIARGALTDEEAISIGERLRESISKRPLPLVEEFDKLSGRDFADEVSLPHESDRKVTVSIGVAVAVTSGNEKEQKVSSRLKRQADLALSISKMSGRDRVRYFSSILNSYGRINSVDDVTGVISIDIGKEVGVKKGQEFFVYPPKYDGATSFYIGEGRSMKRVGTYPKYRAARITTFDVQSEVSFCRIVKKEIGVSEILAGSTLEAIPLGSITHLISDMERQGYFLDHASIRQRISQFEGDEPFCVIAISLRNMEDISETDGVDKANESLGSLSQETIDILGNSAKYGQVSVNSIVAVLPWPGEPKGIEDRLVEVGHAIRKRLGERVDIGIGWTYKGSEDMPQDLPGLSDLARMVDASLLAASIEQSTFEVPIMFSRRALSQAIAKSKADRDFNRAIADYSMFSEFGTASASIENQMGLLHTLHMRSEPDVAESYFRRAVSLSQETDSLTPVLKANLGCWLIANEKYQEGFDLIKDLEVPASYFACRFYGAMRVLSDADFEAYVISRGGESERSLVGSRVWMNGQQLVELSHRLKSIVSEGEL